MTIEGEYLGEPATLEVEGDRMTLRYVPKPGAAQVATSLDATAELRTARFRGLAPFHPLALFFSVGAYFAKMPWLAIAFAAAGIGHAIFRLARPPQVLMLATASERFAIVVARSSLAEARELVRLRAAR